MQKEKSGRGGGGGVNSINLYKRKHVICNILELHHHLFFFSEALGNDPADARTAGAGG